MFNVIYEKSNEIIKNAFGYLSLLESEIQAGDRNFRIFEDRDKEIR